MLRKSLQLQDQKVLPLLRMEAKAQCNLHRRAQERNDLARPSSEDRRKFRRVRPAGKCSRMKSKQGGRKLASRRKKGGVGNLWVPSSSDLRQLSLSLEQYWRRIRSLRGATSSRNLQKGREMHEKLRREGADCHRLFGNALIDVYGKCGDAHEAWDAFCRIVNKSVVSWNFMLGAFVNSRRSRMAIELFRNMESRGVEANAATFSNVVNACSKVGDLETGRQIHAKAVSSGAFASSVIVGNSLISMYAKLKSIDEVKRTFQEMPLKNRISWEQIISASAEAGLRSETLVLHRKMDLEGIKPNASTFVAALEACASEGSQEYGKLIHRRVGQASLDRDVQVAAALVDMYSRWGNFPRALQVFQTVKDKGLLPWTALIKAYVNERYFLEALTLFESMQLEGIRPDISTMEAVIDACAYVTAFARGKQFHEQVLESGMEVTSSLSGRLVEFYTRCEQLDTALRVFSELKGASYSCLVVGFAQHGRLEEAVEALRNMNLEGEEPDQRTFVTILQGCNYGASLKETRKHFQSIVVDYEVAAGVEHYRAVIDTLGRQGRLSKMEDLIRNMPWAAGSREWLSLLAAAERSRDLERAKLAAKKMRKLDFKDHVPFEVMASVYVEQGMWDEAEDMVRKAKMNRLGDSSFIEVRGKLRRFVEGERYDEKLDGFLRRMKDKMLDVGWPLVESRLLKAPPGLLLKEPVEEEERHHSEKLALAFGILEGGEEDELRICNLRHRMCCDCHSIMKYASQVFWKRIVVRDASKFHHFQEGLCSCKDYW